MAVYGSSFPGPEGFIEAICSTMLASNKYNLQHNACFQYVQSAARCLHTSNDYVNVMLQAPRTDDTKCLTMVNA